MRRSAWPRALIGLTGAVIALALVSAGCGGPDDSASRSEDKATTSNPDKDTDTGNVPGTGTGAASAYLGLAKSDAIAKAEADNRPWRIGREDDEQFALSQDFIENRVTFEIDDGKVTDAQLG